MANAFDGLNPTLTQGLRAMIAESKGRIKIVSGYRSYARQQDLWAKALAKYGDPEIADNWVARPEDSHHVDGNAVDLGGDLALAHTLAPKYGLHFPMSHEPWHIQPVGLEPKGPHTYTKPPTAEDAGASVEGAGGDPLDVLHSKLNTLFSFDADAAVGENEQATAGEFDPSFVGGTAEAAAQSAMGLTSSGGGGDELDTFMNAISGQESGGNYNAKNASSGASGRFQIMPQYWASWAQEAGLPSNAPRSAENQDRVARDRMGKLFKKYGNWGAVAEAWYGGEGAIKYSAAAKAKRQSDGPSIDDYRNKVIARMGAK